MSYKENLEATKLYYPFDNWRELFYPNEEDGLDGMEQYSPENCNKVQHVFDDLIENLIKAGEDASEPLKVIFFKIAVDTLNTLDKQIDGLIETGEREDLCELIDKITLAAGLNPADYGDGEGIADEWREW
jgi:hypothetical protein